MALLDLTGRSALTDEDKSFLDRAFGSIADRKTELLAESREVRKPARRDAMGTPEGKIQILRDELKSREAQIARISEIWSVRLSNEDQSKDLRKYLPILATASIDYIGKDSTTQKTVNIKETDPGIAFIKKGM